MARDSPPRRRTPTGCSSLSRVCPLCCAATPTHSANLRVPESPCWLGRDALLARSKRADYCGGRTTDRQHGPQQEVDAHGRISRLHLRNARLTRANQLGHPTLRQFAADPKGMQATGEGQLHLDECGLLLAEAEKLSGRANLSPGSFKTSLFRAVHRAEPPVC